MREEERLPIFILTIVAIVIIICLLAWRNSYKKKPEENNGIKYTNRMSNELDRYVEDKIEK